MQDDKLSKLEKMLHALYVETVNSAIKAMNEVLNDDALTDSEKLAHIRTFVESAMPSDDTETTE